MKELARFVLIITMLVFGTGEGAETDGCLQDFQEIEHEAYGENEETSYEEDQDMVIIQEDATYRSWQEAYAACVSGIEDSDGYTYALIYVNNDNVPELVMDSGYEAGGCMLVTYNCGRIDVLQTSRLYFNYVERGNVLDNCDGHMGYYYDIISKIENGKWVTVAEGTYHDPEDGVQADQNGNYIYEYEWNGNSVTEEEYMEYYTELMQINQGKDPVGPDIYYIRDEMLSYLETGRGLSDGHRYELVRADVSWSEARELCEKKGGYLATITSWEEWDTVTAQIREEEKTGIQFFVGAGRYDGDTDLYSCHWLEEGGNIDWLTNFNVFYDFWLPGEPSYSMTTDDGQEIDEDVVSLFFRSSDDRFYINDVPDDILSATPECSGRIGYICEYDD